MRVFIDKDSRSIWRCSQANRAIKESLMNRNSLRLSGGLITGFGSSLEKGTGLGTLFRYRVRIKTRKSFPGPQRIIGILLGFDSENIAVEADGELLKVPREIITIIRLHPEF